jgi:prepilin-type N-terminal cleavage/methylation domain-containing protein
MNERGFTLIEVLLALALVSLALVGVFGGVLYADRLAARAYPQAQARLLAGECLEAARWLRDAEGLDALASGAYGLDDASGTWELTGAPDATGMFERELTLSPYASDSCRRPAGSPGMTAMRA